MGSNRTGVFSKESIRPTAPPNEADAAPEYAQSMAPGFDTQLQNALADGDLRTARTLVAEREAALAAGPQPPYSDKLADLAMGKARIALAADDGMAAHAILVAAIEANGDHRGLRVLMSEVMLSRGQAADVRPVLTHLGQPPTPHPAPEAGTDQAKDGSA